jgi:hypothetical protein
VAPSNEVRTEIEAWRRDLIARLRRAQLVYELTDTEIDFATLEEEVAQFTRVCRAISWSPDQ